MRTETPLTFRKVELEDADFYFRLTGDPKVMEFITGASHTREESEAELRRVFEKFNQDPARGVWVAQVPQTNQLVGVGALIPMESGDLEIGYRILSQNWGNGYGTLICKELIRIAHTHRFKKLVARVASKNPSSIRILEKLGFSFIGVEDKGKELDKIFHLYLNR